MISFTRVQAAKERLRVVEGNVSFEIAVLFKSQYRRVKSNVGKRKLHLNSH